MACDSTGAGVVSAWSIHELLAGPHPWWAMAMFVGGSVSLIVLLIALVLHFTDRL
jgi:hypothetical protein